MLSWGVQGDGVERGVSDGDGKSCGFAYFHLIRRAWARLVYTNNLGMDASMWSQEWGPEALLMKRIPFLW